MQSFKKLTNLAGIIVLVITSIVFYLTAERTGSLWDCGEFILGAYKLQVVHPPGAGLFVLIGRMFTLIAQMFSNNPSDIAFAVNLMSGLCTAVAAMCIAWITMIMGKIALVGRDGETSADQNLVLTIAGIAAGLSSAWITSVWFSAVEGEVYAMSTMFTALTIWAAVKWYNLPKDNEHDRWIILSIFFAGLSVGVHLLSILSLPALAMLYYYKKFDNKSIKGLFLSILSGVALIWFVQKLVIVGIPSLWGKFELFMVNTLGLPFHTGIIPTILVIGGLAYWLFKFAHKRGNQLLQNLVFAASMIVIAYSTIGVVVIRANADTPVNMNTPNDAMRLIPYLNREQYGERPLLRGPHYAAQPIGVETTERYGRVGNEYKITDEKFDYKWRPQDIISFPRIGHQDKADLHQIYKQRLTGRADGRPTSAYNFKYFIYHQIGWMYMRYFFWNFLGRQNFDQGTDLWQVKDGNYITGFKFLDDKRLYNTDFEPDVLKNAPSRNKYYFIPFLLGILGIVFHYRKSTKDFLALFMLFLITGIGIIVYSNQPPIEPRERDYVLVGSFITFCVWIGLGALTLYSILKENLKLNGFASASVGGALALLSPFILINQNYDDHDRSSHFGSRDYAANFLNSLEKDAILFTYGDNDTYPLWYAQEVENIRRDVRVVNLSLIQVDWYIDKLRKKVNESSPIKFTIPQSAYNGKNLNQIFFTENPNPTRVNIIDVLKNAANSVAKGNEYPNLPYKNFYIPFDKSKTKPGLFKLDSLNIVDSIKFSMPASTKYWTKDDIAIIDLVASNIHDRPVYFSVTCKDEKLQNLNSFMMLEGLGLRVVPVLTQPDRQFGIYGSGRVNLDACKDIFFNRWKYGNFDKHKTHVDKSYLAAVQSMKLSMLRTGFAFLNAKRNKDAADVVNKYFEAFPSYNFPYDQTTMAFIRILIDSGDKESAKKHLKIMANDIKQFAQFFKSIGKDAGDFGNDVQSYAASAGEMKELLDKIAEPAFTDEINKIMGNAAQDLSSLFTEMKN